MTNETNLSLVRELFGRAAYTHKTHEKEAESWRRSSKIIRWASAIAIALTSTSILSDLFVDKEWLPYASSILVTISLGITIYQLSFNPEEQAFRHSQTAKELLRLRERLVGLIADIINERLNVEDVADLRDTLARELSLTYSMAPPTGSQAYKQAQKALKVNEELTFSTEEIDQMLPESLRFSQD